MANVINVDGGLGRVVAAVPAIEKFKRENPSEELYIVTGWPDVFKYNPSVDKVYNFGHYRLWEDVIRPNKYFNPEPYHHDEFYQNKIHLSQSFDVLLNQAIGKKWAPKKPNLYISEIERKLASDILFNLKRQHGADKVLILHPFGSTCKTMPVDPTHSIPRDQRVPGNPTYESLKGIPPGLELFDETYRSLNINQTNQVLDSLDFRFLVLNFSTQDYHHHRINHDRNWRLRIWFALFEQADYFAGVDSAGAHIAKAFNVPSTVFFGGSSAINFGYEDHVICKIDGYPRGHMPFRFDFDNAVNEGAMDFSRDEIGDQCRHINNRVFRTE